MTLRFFSCLILLLHAPLTLAREYDIDVIALFKNRAVLEINGEQVLLSEHGIRLVSADSREAVIRLGDEEFRLDLSSKIGTRYADPSNATVTIQLNDIGQYRTAGSINDVPTSFVVDTGANVVAINASHARQLGIELDGARPVETVTAGGRVQSWEVRLASVEVGGIRASNVQAVVLAGQFPPEVLLGMSFLRNVEINESSGVMVLTSKL